MVNKGKLTAKLTKGRIVVFTLFAVFYAYAATAVLGSIVQDLYGGEEPPPSDTSVEEKREWCVRRLTVLRRDLDERVAQSLHNDRTSASTSDAWAAWLKEWKTRVNDGQRACKGDKNLRRAFSVLERMGEDYDGDLRWLRRTETKLAKQLDEALGQLSD